MNEEPKSIWKRPLTGSRKWVALLAVVAVIAAIIVCIGLVSSRAQSLGDLILTATLLALISSVVILLLVAFVGWLCCWRNFRRLLFGAACVGTLIALAYATENWRGKRAWERHRAEWEAKGEMFDFSTIIPPPVPEEQNFAMTPLLKPAFDFTQTTNGVVWKDTNGLARLERTRASLSLKRSAKAPPLAVGSLEKGTFADLAACREFYRGNTNYPQPNAAGTPAEDILFALNQFAPELRELRAAAESRPLARFPIQYDSEPSWNILLPHLPHIKGLTQLMHVHATAALEAGRSAEAMSDLKVGFRITDSIRDEPLLINHLVRVASLAINLQTLREGLVRHAWSDAQLAEVERYLASLNLLAEYKHAMRGERVCSVSGLDYLRRQGFRDNPLIHAEDNRRGPFSFGLVLMPRGWLYQNMLNISRMHQDFSLTVVDERGHRVFPEISENGTRALENMRKGPNTYFAKLLLPALGKAILRTARMQVYVDAARVACALERYRLANGRLPDHLEALTPSFLAEIPKDVMDAKPLRYRLKADGSYVLYSVGWNRSDDGGELVLKQDETAGLDLEKGDWVWRMPGQ